jgi:hypothetical protein
MPTRCLRTSYQEMFIAGSNYSYTYNEQVGGVKRMQYYLNATAEVAGNLFSLATVATGGEVSDSDPATLLGAVYSQFAKVSVDGRGYLNIGEQDKLAMRLFAGYARAYGNASVLPYSRQFFSGGPNSIRAFLINSVGPGTYFQEQDEIGYFQLGGDVKLELNAEYRFTIYNMFKGAVFADAGNVWLQRSNPAAGGDHFAIPRVLNELAVGAGAGLTAGCVVFHFAVGCGGAVAETVAGGGESLGDAGAGVHGRWMAVGERGAERGDRVSVLMIDGRVRVSVLASTLMRCFLGFMKGPGFGEGDLRFCWPDNRE